MSVSFSGYPGCRLKTGLTNNNRYLEQIRNVHKSISRKEEVAKKARVKSQFCCKFPLAGLALLRVQWPILQLPSHFRSSRIDEIKTTPPVTVPIGLPETDIV